MKQQILVWDLPLRLFHWLLVLAIAACWLTAELGVDYREIHFYSGYLALGLIIFRLIWGFLGPLHARFASFLATPARIKNYMASEHPTTGHNPLGSLMVIAMLVLVFAQAGSGLFINDDILYDGPYYGVLEGQWQELMFLIHDWGFSFIQLAIALHIAAIIFYQRVKKHDLVVPMVTGKKVQTEYNKLDGISGSRLVLALVIAVAVVGFVYWLVVVNPPPVEEFYF